MRGGGRVLRAAARKHNCTADQLPARMLEMREALDAKGMCVAPGIVDLGTFSVDKRACIAGGITRIALMPDQSPPLDDPGLVQRAALAAKPDLWVHPLGAATKGLASGAQSKPGTDRGQNIGRGGRQSHEQ